MGSDHWSRPPLLWIETEAGNPTSSTGIFIGRLPER